MSRASIPVDTLNPGQVFACLGLVEVVCALRHHVRAGFDWSDASAERFVMDVDGSGSPVRDALEFLTSAHISSLAPHDVQLSTSKWSVPTDVISRGTPYPMALPDSPATLPAILKSGDSELRIDHWGDSTRRDNVKFWAGSGGYPGVALLRDAIDLAAQQNVDAITDPFSVSAPQSSSFRFDWRRDSIAIDTGFSINTQKNSITSRGYPWVELLAAIGLTHARPERLNKLSYRYAITGRGTGDAENETTVPPQVLRAALGCGPIEPYRSRRFVMELGWPGQANQARAIKNVYEEPNE